MLLSGGALALSFLGSALVSAQPPAGSDKDAADKPPPIPSVPKLLAETDDEEYTESDETQFYKSGDLKRFQDALKSGNDFGTAEELIVAGARYMVLRMSMKKHIRELPQLRREILQDIRLRAKGNARRLFLREIVKNSEKLLDNNLYVRLNAVILLAKLNSQDPDSPTKRDPKPAVAFAGAAGPLIAVLKDPNQPTSVKIWAVQGLGRIAQTNESLDRDVQLKIATTLSAELQRPNTHEWYQMRLAEALGHCKYIYDSFTREKKPVVVDTLLSAVNDKKRSFLVRTEAAKSLGRVPIDSSTKPEDVAYSLVNLGYEMVLAYNKRPSRVWIDRFFNLYLAFQPIDRREKEAGAGLKQKMAGSTAVNEAYLQVVPLVNHVLKEFGPNGKKQRFGQQRIDQLKGWLEKNRPVSVGTSSSTRREPAPIAEN